MCFSYYQATFNAVGTKCTCTGTEPTSSESTDVSKPSVLNIDNFRKSMLSKHNELRKKHSAGDLKLDKHLNSIAQTHAEKLERTGILKNSDPTEGVKSGENLYYSCGVEITGAIVTKCWYDEVKDYDFLLPGTSMSGAIDNFTQV